MNKLFHDEKILKTRYFDIHQDWEVPVPGFFIISTNTPHRSIEEFSDDELFEFVLLVRLLRRGMTKVLSIRDVYFFQNEDTEHGFHLWVFPRLGWMEKFGRKIQSVRPIMEYAKEHMLSDKDFLLVREYAEKMRIFMQENWQ
jgi:diadenosine tetraphosphate (Ap4A) HIT family hydrolase